MGFWTLRLPVMGVILIVLSIIIYFIKNTVAVFALTAIGVVLLILGFYVRKKEQSKAASGDDDIIRD